MDSKSESQQDPLRQDPFWFRRAGAATFFPSHIAEDADVCAQNP
jgi:hypothetical protein